MESIIQAKRIPLKVYRAKYHDPKETEEHKKRQAWTDWVVKQKPTHFAVLATNNAKLGYWKTRDALKRTTAHMNSRFFGKRWYKKTNRQLRWERCHDCCYIFTTMGEALSVVLVCIKSTFTYHLLLFIYTISNSLTINIIIWFSLVNIIYFIHLFYFVF